MDADQMLKKLFLAAVGLAAAIVAPIQPTVPVSVNPITLSAPVELSTAQAAGTISFSFSQQLDPLGKPLSGCFLYVYQAGTVATPQDSFQDLALTIKHPWPLRCDSSGRLPQFFLADGQIKVRLTDQNGVDQTYPNGGGALDNILVIGPSSGGGGGGSVDPTTIAKTGDLKPRFDVGVDNGWVRANGRTIGSATSGATERANADTQALFLHLWNLGNVGLAVSGGRGVDAASDWAANKTIQLPDWRGRTLGGFDDMGNTVAGRLTATYFGASPTAINSGGGNQSKSLSSAENGPHTHTGSGTTGGQSVGHTHTYQSPDSTIVVGTSGPTIQASGPPGGNTTGQPSVDHNHAFTFTTNSSGTGTAFSIVPPMLLATIYIKL